MGCAGFARLAGVGLHWGMGCGAARGGRDNALAQAGTGREDAVIADLVRARRRDQGREPIDQVAPLYQDVGRAIAPACLEAQREPTVGPLLESVVRDRGARDIATQPFEASAVVRGDADAGVKAPPRATRGALT